MTGKQFMEPGSRGRFPQGLPKSVMDRWSGRAGAATELLIIQSKQAEAWLNSPARRTQSSEIHFPVQKGQSVSPGIFPEETGFPSHPAFAGTHPCF